MVPPLSSWIDPGRALWKWFPNPGGQTAILFVLDKVEQNMPQFLLMYKKVSAVGLSTDSTNSISKVEDIFGKKHVPKHGVYGNVFYFVLGQLGWLHVDIVYIETRSKPLCQ